MTQDLGGVDIYHCTFFEVDSNNKLKFISGSYYNRGPESFKSITEVYDVLRYCMWIIKKDGVADISKYAALVFINRVNDKLNNIEKEYRRLLKSRQIKSEDSLRDSISKPGKTYF